MYTSSPRVLTVITVFLLSQLFSVQCNTSQYVSIPSLLARSEYSQVQIIYDKIGNHMLQPVSSSNLHPVTLIYLSYFNISRETITNLHKILNSEYKISFIVYEYYFNENLFLSQPYNASWMTATKKYFKQTKSVYHSNKNLYKILVSTIPKSSLEKIFQYPRKQRTKDYLFNNFGILLLSRNKNFNLCVHPISWEPKNFTMMQS